MEILALRHQIGVLRRSTQKRPKLTAMDLGVVVRSLGRLAIRAGHRQTRDGHRLAPQRLPLVLDLEDSAWKDGKARGLAASPESDP